MGASCRKQSFLYHAIPVGLRMVADAVEFSPVDLVRGCQHAMSGARCSARCQLPGEIKRCGVLRLALSGLGLLPDRNRTGKAFEFQQHPPPLPRVSGIDNVR